MYTLFRNTLYSKMILLSSFYNIFAASLESNSEEPLVPRFSVRESFEYHPRFNGLLSLSLVNTTQNSLRDYRIVAMIKKDIREPFTPDNITQHVWRFVDESDEVVLPLLNLGFTLAIYRGDFDDIRADRDVINNDNSQQVFILDGEEVAPDVQSLSLIVR